VYRGIVKNPGVLKINKDLVQKTKVNRLTSVVQPSHCSCSILDTSKFMLINIMIVYYFTTLWWVTVVPENVFCILLLSSHRKTMGVDHISRYCDWNNKSTASNNRNKAQWHPDSSWTESQISRTSAKESETIW